jgi:acetylornithine/LysW-gamma-L-lysine aminotransferase
MSAPFSLPKGPLLELYVPRGLSFVRGEGAYLFTSADEPYLDMMSNYGVNILGHNHPHLNEAISAQLKALPTLHGSFGNRIRTRASLHLTQRVSPAPAFVCWSNSGAEAVEAALKFAVLATGRRRFLACRGGYHGKTLGALSATDGAKYRAPFEPLLWRFAHVEYGRSESLAEAVDDATAAILVEPIQGEGGVHLPPPGYLRSVQEICRERGILLILDEIQSGMGRTGRFLASGIESVTADIVCLGKGLGGGIPLGATVVNERVAGRIARSTHTSTFGGNPLACAGALAVLEALDPDLLRHITEVGSYFLDGLRQLRSERIAAVRGRGLMIGVAVREGRDEVLKALQRGRILAIPAGTDVVRFLPPYIIEKSHADRVVETLDRVLR